MKNKRLLIGLMVVVLAFGLSGNVWAATAGQDTVGTGVEAIHIIGIQASGEILSIAAADITAGGGGIPVDDEGILPAYLQYTTITAGTATYEITAQYTGVLPGGTQLQLTTTPALNQGTGVTGAVIPLSPASAVDIVTLIPSCYTGTGSNVGTQVDHVLHILAFADLDYTAASNVSITYTIQDTAV